MGAGQYLSDGERNMRKAGVMAGATLIGSVLPAVPFIFGTSLPCVLTSIGQRDRVACVPHDLLLATDPTGGDRLRPVASHLRKLASARVMGSE
jgi:hypothetical protein